MRNEPQRIPHQEMVKILGLTPHLNGSFKEI